MQKNKTNFSDFAELLLTLPKRQNKVKALYHCLRHFIEEHQLCTGARLPTSRALAKRFKVSRAVVVAAYETLMAEGFVTTRPGAGTFVAANIPQRPQTVQNTHPHLVKEEPQICALGLSALDHRSWCIYGKILSRHARGKGPKNYYATSPLGSQKLREAIANYLKSTRGVSCCAEQIVITSGTQQSLDLLGRALFTPKQRIIMENPGYRRAYDLFCWNGYHVTPVPLDSEGIDIKAINQLNMKGATLFITPSHQFPTGTIMSMQRRLALIAWAQATKSWIFEDDYDGEFRFEGPPLTALQGLDPHGRVIYLGSFSKILFPSLRVGYVVLPPSSVEKVADLRYHVDRHDASLEEEALAEFINMGYFSAHLRRVRKKAVLCRDALIDGILTGSNGGICCERPKQGVHLLITLPQTSPDHIAVKALQKLGISAQPLSSRFLASPVENGLILGFSGFEPEQFLTAGQKLGAYLAGQTYDKTCLAG